jgi:hypothetical protein
LIVSFIAKCFLPEILAGEYGQNYQLAGAHVHALSVSHERTPLVPNP